MVDNSDAAAAHIEAGDGRPKDTALFLVDFMTETCGQRPRCVAAVPTLRRCMIGRAPPACLSRTQCPAAAKSLNEGIAPRDGEVVDQKPGGPDKFLGDDLDQRLKAHGIKTVILCGTSAQGVGLGTGAAAAQRGYFVIYPVDCLLSEARSARPTLPGTWEAVDHP